MGQQWPAAGSGALSEGVHAQDLLKEVSIFFINSTIGLRTNNREGTQSHPKTENLIKDLLSISKVKDLLSIRTRPNFPHSQSLPLGSHHKPLILIHQRAERMKSTITEN